MTTTKPLQIETKKLSDLRPADYNPRTISAEALLGLTNSLTELGNLSPIVWNKRTKRIVGGHQRLKALEAMGETETDVVVVSLSAAKEKAANIALNNPHIQGEFTDDLQELLRQVRDDDTELFGELRLDELLTEPDPEPIEGQEDGVPEPPKNPVTKPGDVWQLGRHTLGCFDGSADPAFFSGADAIVTDPPYGISVVKSGMVGAADFGVAQKGSYEPVAGDDETPDIRWLLEVASRSVIWGGNYFAHQLPPSGSWLVWDKRCDTGIINTFADCELAWSNCGGPARVHRQLWNGMIREGEHEKRSHPTQKPVKLMVWCVHQLGDPEIVADPYLGSGTTLVAAEQLDLACRGTELAPAYCDVIIERWQNLTGGKAQKI